MTTTGLEECDVCIVGGGPAGLATAIALSQEGYRVLVADCAIPPIDKPCGEGLMPESLMALRELGVIVSSEAGFAFNGIQFSDGRSTIAADFPNGCGIGLRRTVLHDLLLQRAEELEVSFAWGAKHVTLSDRGVFVNDQLVKASLVVGADGNMSSIRRQERLHQIRSEHRRYGFRRHYRVAPWSSYMELYWGLKFEIYVTPVSRDEVCVALLSEDPKLRLDQALTAFPQVRSKLEKAAQTSSEMGALSLSRVLRRVQRESVALVGDASGSVDAITGAGMCLSFKQAAALAHTFKSGDLSKYQEQHEAIGKTPHRIASLMLSLGKYAKLRKRVMANLADRPRIFASFLAIHTGTSSFLDLRSEGLFKFGLACLAGELRGSG